MAADCAPIWEMATKSQGFPLSADALPRCSWPSSLEDPQAHHRKFEQTPQSPNTCQCGLFFANHDESDAEMVTDIRERDYRYDEYAVDQEQSHLILSFVAARPMMEKTRRRSSERRPACALPCPGTPIISTRRDRHGDNVSLSG